MLLPCTIAVSRQLFTYIWLHFRGRYLSCKLSPQAFIRPLSLTKGGGRESRALLRVQAFFCRFFLAYGPVHHF